MAEKTISPDKLKTLIKAGADVKFPPKSTQIEDFGELVKALNTMVSNEQERIRADIARNQTNLEILATLQSMIRKQGEGPKVQDVDLSPIKDMIDELRAEREAREQASYKFDIKRDGRGFAQEIYATPIKPTQH